MYLIKIIVLSFCVSYPLMLDPTGQIKMVAASGHSIQYFSHISGDLKSFITIHIEFWSLQLSVHKATVCYEVIQKQNTAWVRVWFTKWNIPTDFIKEVCSGRFCDVSRWQCIKLLSCISGCWCHSFHCMPAGEWEAHASRWLGVYLNHNGNGNIWECPVWLSKNRPGMMFKAGLMHVLHVSYPCFVQCSVAWLDGVTIANWTQSQARKVLWDAENRISLLSLGLFFLIISIISIIIK